MMAARELVSNAILSAIKKTTSQSSRATKVKEIGQEILQKVGHGAFNEFSSELVKCPTAAYCFSYQPIEIE